MATVTTAEKLFEAVKKLPESAQQELLKFARRVLALQEAEEMAATGRAEDATPMSEAEIAAICDKVREANYEKGRKLRA